MAPLQNPLAQLEVGHVLFLDIVGYTRLPMDEQARLLALMHELVRGTAEFQRAEANHELLRQPSGDGMALVFLRRPVAPVLCAMDLARALRRHAELAVRMGIHSGPVNRLEDINDRTSFAGAGINFAQRVMDCGDAGHILMSNSIAEVLQQLGHWDEYLHDLGVAEVKHGQRVHLYNFYSDTFGRPEVPERLRAPSRGGLPEWTAASAAATPVARVVLLYKRGAMPDEHLLAFLEAELGGQGFGVFIDRHLSIGVQWAKEIEHQVRTADAVIPLLSAASVQSEMLACEVELAHDAAQQQKGKPRLLPVRVDYAGPLPEPLDRILGPLQQAVWHGPEENAHLARGLVDAIRNPAPEPPKPLAKLEAVGGAVPLDSKFYVVRPTDEELTAAMERRDSIVLIKGARQMGKTSLLARGLQQARRAGAAVVLTDFQTFNAEHLASPQTLFLTLAEWIATQLDLELPASEKWDARSGANLNFQRFMRREVLAVVPKPVVWGLDEVDRLFTCGFASEVFGLFRSWHNARSLDPEGPWSRLTLAIAYATEAHLFITDINQSPFNVGTRIVLADFDLPQVAELNERYGSPLRGSAELSAFQRLLNGQPYLVRRGLHEMVTRGLGLSAFEAEASRDDGIYGDHLRRILVLLAKDHELCEIMRGVLLGQPCPTPESFYRLRSPGLVRGDSARDARPRCELYGQYLRRHLL